MGGETRTAVVVADWIKRLVDDERERGAVRVREKEEPAARKADLVRLNGRRLIDVLRATVTRDLEAFRNEFPGDRARHRLGSHGTRGRVSGAQAGISSHLLHGRAASGKGGDELPLSVHADQRPSAA